MSKYTDLTLQNGYVFYQRLGDPGQKRMWINLYNKISGQPLENLALEEIRQMGMELKNLGKKELQKEAKLISKIIGNNYFSEEILSSGQGTLKLIKILNGLIAVRQLYEQTLSKVGEKGRKEKSQDLGKIFYEKFSNNLKRTVAEGRAREDLYLGVNWTLRIKNAIDKALKETLKKNFTDPTAEEAWATLLKEYDFIKKELDRELWGILNEKGLIDKLVSELKNKEEDLKYFLKVTDKSPSKKQVLKEIGDLIKEPVGGLITSQTIKKSSPYLAQTLTIEGGKENKRTSRNKIAIVDIEAESNLGEVLNKMGGSIKNLKLSNILRQSLQKLSGVNDSFIIYENTKDYKIGKNFRGFNMGSKVSTAERLQSFLLENSSLPANRVENFIAQIVNIADGAIYESKRGEVREHLSILLSRAVGQLLFDEFEETAGNLAGKGKATSIYIFSLSGLKVPLSYLLRKIGDTFIELSKEIRQGEMINVSIAKTNILYPTPIKDITDERDIYWYWDVQRERARTQSIISGRFMPRFRQLLNELQSI